MKEKRQTKQRATTKSELGSSLMSASWNKVRKDNKIIKVLFGFLVATAANWTKEKGAALGLTGRRGSVSSLTTFGAAAPW